MKSKTLLPRLEFGDLHKRSEFKPRWLGLCLWRTRVPYLVLVRQSVILDFPYWTKCGFIEVYLSLVWAKKCSTMWTPLDSSMDPHFLPMSNNFVDFQWTIVNCKVISFHMAENKTFNGKMVAFSRFWRGFLGINIRNRSVLKSHKSRYSLSENPPAFEIKRSYCICSIDNWIRCPRFSDDYHTMEKSYDKLYQIITALKATVISKNWYLIITSQKNLDSKLSSTFSMNSYLGIWRTS